MMTELASQHNSKDAIVYRGISVQLTVIQMAEIGCSWQSETFIWRGVFGEVANVWSHLYVTTSTE